MENLPENVILEVQEKVEAQKIMQNLRENFTPDKEEQEKAADKRRKEILWQNATPENKDPEKAADKRRKEHFENKWQMQEMKPLKS